MSKIIWEKVRDLVFEANYGDVIEKEALLETAELDNTEENWKAIQRTLHHYHMETARRGILLSSLRKKGYTLVLPQDYRFKEASQDKKTYNSSKHLLCARRNTPGATGIQVTEELYGVTNENKRIIDDYRIHMNQKYREMVEELMG